MVLQVLAFLTATEPMALAVDLWVGEKFYHAEFGGFTVEGESERYRTNIPYFRGGSAGTGNLVGGHHQNPFVVLQPGGLYDGWFFAGVSEIRSETNDY